MVVNVLMVLFNMIPAFPMDGGRVLRALLATQMKYSRATQIAASIGQGVAILFGVIGFLYNPFLVFIALFVWIGAAQESGMARVKEVIGGIPVKQAMTHDFKFLEANDSLSHAVELAMASQAHAQAHHGQAVDLVPVPAGEDGLQGTGPLR